MRRSGEEEYQRIMGFRASHFSWLTDRPAGSEPAGERESAVLSHPIAWVRWRLAVRRHGPYAPGFDEFRARHE